MAQSPSPYDKLPRRSFWKTAVAQSSPLDHSDLYRPKFKIDAGTKIATAGSCFAQVLGRALKEAGMTVLDREPFVPGLSDELARRYGYRQFSARYGNIYTMRHLWQLVWESRGAITPSYPVWEKAGRFYDAMRPSVEPKGLPSVEDVLAHREDHLQHVRAVLHNADVFVFTFGLVEAWTCIKDGTVYPTAPGTIAGHYDPEIFALKTFRHSEILSDFQRVRKYLKRINPDIRFLVTTSPVPLTATASDDHAEVANSYSKATLRSVCGELRDSYDDVDYFPSYEIITAQKARGVHFEPNLHGITATGRDAVISCFLAAHGLDPNPKALTETQRQAAELQCEDLMLETFAR